MSAKVLGLLVLVALAGATSTALADEPTSPPETADALRSPPPPARAPEGATPPDSADPQAVAPAPVSAPAPAPAPSEQSARKRHWYGFQTLALDAGAVALSATALVLAPEPKAAGGAIFLGALGGGTYVFGGPIVHFAHRNVKHGFASLALRVGLPVVGAWLPCPSGASKCTDPAMYGALVGVAAAMVMDTAVLAFDSKPKDATATRPANPGAAIAPAIALTRNHGAIVGLSAIF